jgi:hypothetical protein
MMRAFSIAVLGLLAIVPGFPQTAGNLRQAQSDLQRRSCPGDPPGDLGSLDCRFTQKQRLTQFVAGSITDQAIFGAVFFGTIAHIRNDPKEWDRGLDGFGYRIGSRYAQGVTKGLTNYTFSTIMRTDPRHISYMADPGTKSQDHYPIGSRIGHAFLDWITVRRSTVDGNGRRLPNLPLLAGAAASGFVGNAWYPDRLTVPGEAMKRGAGSLGTALASSFYTEFSPEVSRLLGALFKRGSTKKAAPIAAGGTSTQSPTTATPQGDQK